MITAVLILTQASLVLTSIGSGTSKMEPTCWGPGIWPHPHHCRLFTLCLLDLSKVHNMVTGQLFLCPPGTGFSAGRNACVPSKLVTNCNHNTKNADSAVETSPAEHLLSAQNTSQFHCAGHSVPYCDGSDVLVVCGPSQGLLGAVNCSEKTLSSPGSYQCDKTAGRCVPAEDAHTRGVPVHLHSGPSLKTVTNPGRGRSLAVSRGSLATEQEHKPAERSSSHSVGQPLSCERPGKQCSRVNNTQLIHCSDDLQVIARWDCYSFFPLVLYQNGVEVVCDSEKDTCVVQIGNTSQDINKTTRVPDVTRNVCKHPGRQCVPGNTTVIAECSADLEVQHVWNCASLFPSQTVLAMSSVSFECDSHSNSCVMSFGIASGELHTTTTTTTSPQMDCKHPGIQCSTKNNSLLLQCSDNLEVLNTWPCGYLFPLEAFQDRRAVDTLCDPQRDSCVLYLNEQLLDQGQKPVLVNEHQCTAPGMQCSANNSSVLLVCSEILNVLHAWDCASLVPSEMLQDDVLKVTCDQHHSSCILYIESDNSQKDTAAETKCRKPGKQCSNMSVLMECSDSLEVLSEWNCASMFPQQVLGDSAVAQCSFELDRCVLSYPATSTSKLVAETSSVTPTEASLFISQSCQKEGLQCANNHTIMDCPYDLSEPNFMMSCADMIQMSHNDKALGYCDMETSSCVLKANQETLHLKLSIFDMTEHTVFPDFVSKCAKGGLHCADNMTLVMCSGLADNLDYAIMCGQRLSSSGTSIKSFCDPQMESCVIDTQTDTTPDNRNVLTTLAPTSLASSTSPSWQKLLISQLKDELPTKQMDEVEMCTSPGWRCLNQDVLILCSDQLSLRGYLPCSEAYRGYEGRGFCDNTASKCALDNNVN